VNQEVVRTRIVRGNVFGDVGEVELDGFALPAVRSLGGTTST
jgi:hypothetical protein